MGTAHRKNENLAAGVTCERLFGFNRITVPTQQKTRLNAPQLIILSFCSIPAGDRCGCTTATAPRAVARLF